MCLDSEGIVRVSRWKDETGGYPQWRAIGESIGGDAPRFLSSLAPRVRKLSGWLEQERVPARVQKDVLPRIERVLADLGDQR